MYAGGVIDKRQLREMVEVFAAVVWPEGMPENVKLPMVSVKFELKLMLEAVLLSVPGRGLLLGLVLLLFVMSTAPVILASGVTVYGVGLGVVPNCLLSAF